MITRSKPKRGDRAKAAKARTRKLKRARHAELLVKDCAARDAVFERDGWKCVICGRQKVQWCHVFSRRHKHLRHDPENALALCAGHHLWWHHAPAESGAWFFQTYPARFQHLMEARRKVK